VIEIRDKGNNNKRLGAFCSEFDGCVTLNPSNDNSEKGPISSIIFPTELGEQWDKNHCRCVGKRRAWFAAMGIDEDDYDDGKIILPTWLDDYAQSKIDDNNSGYIESNKPP